MTGGLETDKNEWKIIATKQSKIPLNRHNLKRRINAVEN